MLAWWSPLQETVRRWSEHKDARLGRSQVKQWGLQPGRRLIRAGMPIQYRGLGLQEHGSHHSGRRPEPARLYKAIERRLPPTASLCGPPPSPPNRAGPSARPQLPLDKSWGQRHDLC
jgi:hypothetical protein